MDEKELEFSLEDILKDFGQEETEPAEEPQVLLPEDTAPQTTSDTIRMEPVVTAETVRMDAVTMEQTVRLDLPAEDDTIRLDTAEFGKGEAHNAQPLDEPEFIPTRADAKEAFEGTWEPEYEQPMGEYVPPQPIIFHPRSRIRELKKKLVEGPERRYYQLSEQGVGKLQIAIFLSLLVVLISAGSTVLYALGLVQEDRMRLMVFGQFFAMLLSVLLGSYR